MKQVSSSLATAIESGERVVFHDLQVDWDNDGYDGPLSIDDVSRKVSSVQKSHSLTTDLPPEVRMVPGVAVAELSMALGHGNLVQNPIAVSYKSVTTGSSGSSTTQTYAYIPKPSGAVVGEVILVALMTSSFASPAGINGYTNVEWSILALRGDGLGPSVTGWLLTRRVAVNEPDTYIFRLGDATIYSGTAIRVGDAYIAGIHQFVTKGRDDSAAASATVTGIPITTTLPTTLISIFTADTGPIVSGSWTADPTNGDVERADFTTSAATGGHNISTAVMTRDNVAPGTYTSQATFSGVVDATLVFTIALSGRPSGDERQHAAWTFSELNPVSPYAGKIRSGRKTRWRVGFAGTAGVEYVNMFTGQTLDGGGSSRNRLSQISALDNRETLRNPAIFDRLGAWVADVDSNILQPGLEATHVVSFLLAQAFRHDQSGMITPQFNLKGYFASYPPHPSTLLWLPCHGSFYPHDLSDPVIAYTQDSLGRNDRVKFARGPFVGATEGAPMSPGFTRGKFLGFASEHAFVDATSQTAGRIQFMGLRLTTTATALIGTEPNTTTSAKLEITAAGVLRLVIATEAGISRTVTGPAVPTDLNWHFYGVHWNSTTTEVVFRIDGTATTGTLTAWANSALTNTESASAVRITDGMQIAEVMVMTGVI